MIRMRRNTSWIFPGRTADLLLEKNATLLHAVEHVVLKAIRWMRSLRRIAFDCQIGGERGGRSCG